MKATKTLIVVLTTAFTGDAAADFLASKPVLIALIIVAVLGWRYAINQLSKPS